MIFNFDDLVRIKGGYYRGSIAKVVGRADPCTEETEKYLVEILKGASRYDANMGIWVEVSTKSIEFLDGKRE